VGEFCVSHFDYGAVDAAVRATIEPDAGVMRLAAGGHDLRILDLHQVTFEADQGVPLARHKPAKRRQLYVLLLQSAVGKK